MNFIIYGNLHCWCFNEHTNQTLLCGTSQILEITRIKLIKGKGFRNRPGVAQRVPGG